MQRISTYVFIDLETTGLPKLELNKTRITELSMVAVKRDHLLDTRAGAIPRVQNKLTLCFNPGRAIMDDSSKVTGLDNFLLEDETPFNKTAYNTISNFLNVLSKPVCLIAQNGLNYDYPILKNHLVKLNVSFPEDLMCADCYHGFYDILEEKKQALVIEAPHNKGDIITEVVDEEKDLSPSAMQLINETTPVSKKIQRPLKIKRDRLAKVCRKMPFSVKPTDSYKLGDVYKRILNRPPIEAHRAENDCLMALEISVVLNNEFVQWVDENQCYFTDVKPMKLGVPLGE